MQNNEYKINYQTKRPTTAFETQFQERWASCISERTPYLKQWNLIEHKLYRLGWEDQQLQTQKENLLRESLQWNVADHNVTEFHPEISAISLDHIDAAEQINKIVNSEWQRLDLASHMQEVITDKFTYGHGVSEIYFDKDEKIENKTIGIIKVRRINPRHIFFDTNAGEMRDVTYCIIKYQMTLKAILNWDIVKNDPELPQAIIKNLPSFQHATNDIMLTPFEVGQWVEQNNPKLDVFVYYITRKNEKGILKYYKCFMVNGTNPIKLYETMLPFKFFPFAILFDHKIPGKLYGNSLLQQGYFFQVAIDDVNEVLTRSINAQKVPILLVDDAAKIDIEKINQYDKAFEDGTKVARVLKYKGLNTTKTPLFFVEQSSISRDLLTQYQLQLDGFRRQMNLSKTTTAESTGSITTKGGLALAQERASEFNFASLVEIKRYCRKLIKILLYFIKTYYNTTRSFDYVLDEIKIAPSQGKIQKYNYIKYKGSDIDLSIIKYHIAIDSLTKSQQERQFQNLMQFFTVLRQYQETPNALIKESDLIKVLDVPNKEKLLLKALVNEYENRFRIAEQVVAISRQAVLNQVITFFNELEFAKELTSARKMVLLAHLAKFFQIKDIEKLAKGDINPNMGEIVQTIASLLEISIKK